MVTTTIQQDVRIPAKTGLNLSRILLESAIKKVLNEAFREDGPLEDKRRGILTVVYNYETEAYEARWDLAK